PHAVGVARAPAARDLGAPRGERRLALAHAGAVGRELGVVERALARVADGPQRDVGHALRPPGPGSPGCRTRRAGTRRWRGRAAGAAAWWRSPRSAAPRGP